MICTAAVVVAAVMELRMSCQRCYNTYGTYHVQYLQQQLPRSYRSTQLRCGPSHVSVFRYPLINGRGKVRSVQTCANAARTHHTIPLQPFTSLSKTMKVSVSLSQLSKASPNKRACTRSRPLPLLSLLVVLEYLDFLA